MADNLPTVGQVSSLAEIEAAQIDQQIATAKRYPRDEERAIAKAVKLATYSVQTAQSMLYFRPVGKDKHGRQTFAEGASIRCAEVLKSSWGNLRLGTRVVGEKDGNIHVQAVCHDLEANVFETSEVAKSITGRNGRYQDTMIQVIIGAASKIALRNVIFSVIPKAYAQQILDECKSMIVGDDEQKAALMEAVIASFAEMGIDKEKLFSVVDRKDYPAGSNDELVFLIGLNNAIKDEICKVEEVFGGSASGESSKPKVTPTTPKQTEKAAEKPEEVKPKKDKKEAEKKPAQPEAAPAPMGADEFKSMLLDAAKKAGYKTEDEIIGVLDTEFSIRSIAEIPAAMQSQILDHFIA